MRALTIISILLALVSSAPASAQGGADRDLDVITGWRQYSDAENNAYHHFLDEATRLLGTRSRDVASLETAESWLARREKVLAALVESVGDFPERTPLRTRVLGTVQKHGYRVEKLVYESVPGFYVTAALFVPEGRRGPAPGILFCSGHAAEGFRSPAYQTMILNLVDKGFVVLAFDPVGQGERLEYDVDTVGGPTKQHSYPGAQGFLLGGSPARQMIWDGIRGLDLLASRAEVDPSRLGVAGRSGGGTQTAYIAAFDERVAAAAPEAYITSMGRLLASAGPQDVEQILFHGLRLGLDHADLILARAPKPTLLIATTRDFFSVQGVRETFAELQRAYDALDERGALAWVEDDAPHASTRRNREAMYGFFQEHLGVDGSAAEKDIAPLSEAELRVTPTGQLRTSLGGESTFDLNRESAKTLLAQLEARRGAAADGLPQAVEAARTLSGFRSVTRAEAPVFTGRFRRDGYAVEKYFLEGDGHDVLPYLVLVPEGPPPYATVLYLDPEGKSAQANPGGEMERLVRAGYLVAAPDVLGIGETGPGDFEGDAQFGDVSYNLWFASILVGRSLVGERARDVVRLVSALTQRPDVDPSRLAAVSRGELGPVLLHAAAFEPRIRRVALMRPLDSYASIVLERDYAPRFVPSSVAGALTGYDLPDLAASLAPRLLWTAGLTDATAASLSSEEVEGRWSHVREAHGASWTHEDVPDLDAFIGWLQDESAR